MRNHVIAALVLTALAPAGRAAPAPWQQAGLTPRQAAAHLLDRFAYGARPGEVERVAALGPDLWLAQQLAGLPDPGLERDLRQFDALAMTSREILAEFPPPAQVMAEAVRAGVVERPGDAGQESSDRGGARGELRRFGQERGYRSQRELLTQLGEQRLWRAVESENQLREVLVDFWSNHFNVSLQDRQARPFLLSYERDAIRPRVLGSFRDLLEATAKHPAMLLYLDNAQSVASGTPSMRAGRERPATQRFLRRRGAGGLDEERTNRRPRGLNDNYARELLELHTLGVDGGFTQQDVVEVARAFTGWSLLPPRLAAGGRQGISERRFARPGVVLVEGDFLFRAAAHDDGAKTVLGHRLAPGRGIEDGEQVLDILAAHPSTARHVARALAIRFVSDQPPPTLVDRLAAVFASSGGSISACVRALADAPEFWAQAREKSKIKTPFELVASALRALDAQLSRSAGAEGTLAWLYRLGQLPFGYQAPTGYPDRAEHWVSSGALVERMSFGLALAAGEVRNARIDLAALATLGGGHVPATPQEALGVYAPRLLPERDLSRTLPQMREMAADPGLARRLSTESRPASPESPPSDPDLGPLFAWRRGSQARPVASAPSALEQVVGVILGSPEFQRR